MARLGIDHSKAVVPFEVVELARDLKEQHAKSRLDILAILNVEHGFVISMNTLDDWLYYRTRLFC